MATSALQPRTRTTVDEYLDVERTAIERYTFLDGVVLEMAGESGEHSDITSNLVMLIGSQLKGTPRRAWTAACALGRESRNT